MNPPKLRTRRRKWSSLFLLGSAGHDVAPLSVSKASVCAVRRGSDINMKILNTGDSIPAALGGHNADSSTAAVRSGEGTLSQVASRLGVDLDDLCRANPQIANPNSLTPGQEIRIPATATGGPPASNATDGTSDEGAAGGVPTDASKRMESRLDAAVMRVLINSASRGAMPADSGVSGKGGVKREPVLDDLLSGKKYSPEVKKQLLEGLKTVSENVEFKKLDPADQTSVLKTLAANPP